MSSAHNFGRNVDGFRANSYCIGSHVICNNRMESNFVKTTTKELVVKGNLDIGCIEEKTSGEGVVAQGLLNLDTPGIGRLHLNTNLNLKQDDSVELDGTELSVSFSTEPDIFIQNGHALQMPLSYPNPRLGNSWVAMVEVNATLVLEYEVWMDHDLMVLEVIKNEIDVVSKTVQTIVEFPSNSFSVGARTLHLHDVIQCSPGDSLDFRYSQQSDIGSTTILDDFSHFSFKVLTFQNPVS